MFIYTIGSPPLINSLEDICRWMQLWYADDASAGLLVWFKLLCFCVPSFFSYCPQPAKCFVVVASSLLVPAKNILVA